MEKRLREIIERRAAIREELEKRDEKLDLDAIKKELCRFNSRINIQIIAIKICANFQAKFLCL